MKRIQTLLVFLFISTGLLAQKPNSFLIYSVKGTVTVSEDDKSSKAQIGKLLNDRSKIIVGQNSLVSIICNENSLFSVVKPGTYNMTQFKDSCLVNKSSITSNYLKFIWNQLTTPKGSPEKNRKSYMNNLGAVSRTNISIWVDSRLDTINYYNGEFPISWKCYSDVTEFDFQLLDDTKPVFQKNIKGATFINIPDFSDKLKINQPYTWTLKAKDEENTETRILIKWDKPSYEKLVNRFIAAKNSPETEAEESFRLGFLLESARFYSEAYQYYKKASQLSPDMELYQKTLDAFKKDYHIE
ncbi:MAG: hypothetical protein K2Q24_01000 [Chitinophagaceae bacterium]|jgi:hypothetical protein|nr:hypothetical protein [Chitinophagaceae bacterium]